MNNNENYELMFIQKIIEDNDLYNSTRITYKMFVDPFAKVIFNIMAKNISRLGEFKPLIHLKGLCEDEQRVSKFNQLNHEFKLTNDPQDILNYLSKYSDKSIKALTLEKFIEDNYIKRKLLDLTNNIVDSVEDSTSSVRDLVIKSSIAMDNLLLSAEEDILIKSGKDLSEDFIQYLDSPEKDLYIPTGIDVIDRVSGGSPKSALISIVATAKRGKSMVLVDSCIFNLRQGRKCIFFSIEMSDKDVFQRMISRYSGIEYNKIAKKELSQDEIDYLKESINQFKDEYGDQFEMYTDKNGMTVKAIESFIMKKQRGGQEVDDIFIDYLQILTEPTKQSKPEQMMELCKQLRQLKQKTGVRIFVPAQLKSSATQKDINDITEDDINYSKELARECDSLLVLHKDKNTGLSQMKFILSRQQYDQDVYFFPEQNLNMAKFGKCMLWDDNIAVQISKRLGLYQEIQQERAERNSYIEGEWE